MDYTTMQMISGITGLIIFIALFVGVLIYALRPKNKAKFDHAARLPLDDNERARDRNQTGDQNRSRDPLPKGGRCG